jgi:ribosome-binding factor A
MTLRQEKVSSLIKNLAGEFLQREAGKASMITVTKTDISRDLKNAKVYFSVFPEDKEVAALDFAKRKRTEFREFFRQRSKLRVVPFFDFDIDLGEKSRQKIDGLTNNT